MLCTILAVYNFCRGRLTVGVTDEQLPSRWPAVILLVVIGLGYLSWLPLNLAMPIGEVQWVGFSAWFPASFCSPCCCASRLLHRLVDGQGAPGIGAARRCLDRRADRSPQPARSVRGCRCAGTGPAARWRRNLGAHLRSRSFQGDQRPLRSCLGRSRAQAVCPHGIDASQWFERGRAARRRGVFAIRGALEAFGAGEAVRRAFANSAAFVDGLAVGATVSVGAASDVGSRATLTPCSAGGRRSLCGQAGRAQSGRAVGTSRCLRACEFEARCEAPRAAAAADEAPPVKLRA